MDKLNIDKIWDADCDSHRQAQLAINLVVEKINELIGLLKDKEKQDNPLRVVNAMPTAQGASTPLLVGKGEALTIIEHNKDARYKPSDFDFLLNDDGGASEESEQEEAVKNEPIAEKAITPKKSLVTKGNESDDPVNPRKLTQPAPARSKSETERIERKKGAK